MMLSILMVFLLAGVESPAAVEWPSWGGPHGDFSVGPGGLTTDFAAAPPKRLWERNLGDGFSSIVTDGKLLYTMYRRGEQEVVVAIDASNGATKWEYGYDTPFPKGSVMENGPGPHSTPLIFGDKLYTIGVLGKMHAFN